MRFLTLAEVLDLHRRLIKQSGGAAGVRDLTGVESAVAQPQMTFGGDEIVILALAAGDLSREELLQWVTSNTQRMST